jgi:hypothetical protein
MEQEPRRLIALQYENEKSPAAMPGFFITTPSSRVAPFCDQVKPANPPPLKGEGEEQRNLIPLPLEGRG